jgi:hypothetical protein
VPRGAGGVLAQNECERSVAKAIDVLRHAVAFGFAGVAVRVAVAAAHGRGYGRANAVIANLTKLATRVAATRDGHREARYEQEQCDFFHGSVFLKNEKEHSPDESNRLIGWWLLDDLDLVGGFQKDGWFGILLRR